MRDIPAEYEALFAAECPREIDGIPTAKGLASEAEEARVAALGAFMDATVAERVSWRARVMRESDWADRGDSARFLKGRYREIRRAWARLAGLALDEPSKVHVRTTPTKKPKIQWQLTFNENVAAQQGLFG